MKHESADMERHHRSVVPVLGELLQAAGLPAAASIQPLTGYGFENEVFAVELADGRQVVLRRWREPREPEQNRARFLESQALPVPHLLAGTREASLYAFVHGALLGDLLETHQCTAETWRMVGHAFRRLHAVRFPAGLEGDRLPHLFVLQPIDPVARLHDVITL